MLLMPYVQRRRGGYYYRQRVPKALQRQLNRTELVFSLRTRCPKLAFRRAAELYVALHPTSPPPPESASRLLMTAADPSPLLSPLSHARAARIAESWKRRELNRDFDERLAGTPPPGSPGDHRARRDAVLADLARVDLGSHAARIDAALAAERVPLERGSPDWRRAGYYLLQAEAERLAELSRRADPAAGHVMTHLPPPPPPEGPAPGEGRGTRDDAGPAVLLRDALAGWARAAPRRPGTLREWETAIRRWTELLGNRDVRDITKQDVRDYRAALLRLPVRLSRDDRKRTLPELLRRFEGAEAARSSPATVNKSLTAIGSVLAWCVDQGILEANPAEKVRVKAPRQRKRRQPFSPEDLRAIFIDSPLFAPRNHRNQGNTPHFRGRGGAGEAGYWLPWLALYTGARLEELGQLACDDVREQGGVVFLDINGQGEGKSLKTASSWRRVPLHPRLAEQGFLEYVERTRRRGHRDVFPHLRSAGVQRTAAFSKWINTYLRRDCGITDRAKVFHSFRHTFKDACRDAGLSREVHDALTGHADSSVSAGYGAGPSLTTLAAAIARVDYPALSPPETPRPLV